MVRKKSGKSIKTQGSGVSDDTGECLVMLMEELLWQSKRIEELEAAVVGLQVVVGSGIVDHGSN